MPIDTAIDIRLNFGDFCLGPMRQIPVEKALMNRP